jgi:hypothetical protein
MCDRSSISNKFKSLDNFGSSIALNYHGDDTYKTKVGAFASLILQIFTFYILVTKGRDMILGINPDFISYTISQDMNAADPQIMIKENKFNFAFGIYNLMKNTWEPIPEEFGYFKVLKWEIEDMNIMPSKKIPLKTHFCKPEDFPMATPEI